MRKPKYNGYVKLFDINQRLIRKIPAKTKAIVDSESRVRVVLRKRLNWDIPDNSCFVELSDDSFVTAGIIQDSKENT